MVIKTNELRVGDDCFNVGAIVKSIQYHKETRNYTITFQATNKTFELVASRNRSWVISDKQRKS
jgi:hypothetical protein